MFPFSWESQIVSCLLVFPPKVFSYFFFSCCVSPAYSHTVHDPHIIQHVVSTVHVKIITSVACTSRCHPYISLQSVLTLPPVVYPTLTPLLLQWRLCFSCIVYNHPPLAKELATLTKGRPGPFTCHAWTQLLSTQLTNKYACGGWLILCLLACFLQPQNLTPPSNTIRTL